MSRWQTIVDHFMARREKMKTNKSLFFLLAFLGGMVIANGIEASNPKESHPPRQSPAQAVATNGFYDLIVEDVFGSSGIGTYTVRTGQNHPITVQYGQKQDILYGGAAGSPWSTYLTVRSYDSNNEYVSVSNIYGISASPGFTVYYLDNISDPPPTVLPIGTTGFRTIWYIPGGGYVDLLKIEQVTTIEGTTVDDSRIRVSTIVTNLGTSSPASIGIRYEWDIMIDGNDGSWFAPRLPNDNWLSVETEWSPPQFQHYETTNDPNNPVFRILGSVNGPVFSPSVTPPDVLQFVAWGSIPSPGLFNYAFDFTHSGRIIGNYDSAIGYCWGKTLGQALVISAGGSSMVTQYLYLREPHYLDLSTTAPIPTQMYEGGHLCFDVIVEDSDPTHVLHLSAENVPSFATWTDASGTTPLIQQFCVDPGYDDAGNYLVRFIATDGILVDTEEVNIEVINVVGNNQVKIPNKVYERFGFGHWDYLPEQDPDAGDNCIVFDEACPGWAGINPGDFFEIPIILENFQVPIGGFELEVDFDYIDLTFYGAERGGLLEGRRWQTGVPPGDSTFWSWEYFSYRVLPCPTCACCKYKILLYGQAEMPDGDMRRGYCLDPYWNGIDYEGFWYEDQIMDDCPQGEVIDAFATLAWLKFQVANNELLRDLKLPIVFEWEHKLYPDRMEIWQDWDCAENTFSNCGGTKLYVSDDLLQYNPVVCGTDTPAVMPIFRFIDGGVHICSPCTAFTCVRGDINMDKVPYSTADAVMFANYFVHGLGVFTIDRDEQVCATDVNADGRTLMLADLIYLIRVIQHDAIPFPKLGPSSDVANVIVSDGKVTVECASAIGGILFKFDGKVSPTLLNTNMELLSNEGNVLVWSSEGHSINAGASQLLTVSGDLVSVIAVDREGRDLATTINAKVTPTTFALHPAYPNPFNPNTNLSFTLPNAVSYSLNIYNVAGQLVRSYEGTGNVGLNVITWNGKDNASDEVASGIYFYKLIAGQHQATRKMVILK
jgi:hypothetical protein